MKADYVHKDSRTLEEKPQVFTRWIDPTIEELKRENQELKSQLEDKIEDYKRMRDNFRVKVDILEKLENQQKEFIEYLENEMKSWTEALNKEHDYELVQEFAFKCNIYEEILSKYKQIIGKDINVGTKGGK